MNASKARVTVAVPGTLLQWMAVHGNLCVALRHPQNNGISRELAEQMILTLSELLVREGLLSPEEMEFANRVERERLYRNGGNA